MSNSISSNAHQTQVVAFFEYTKIVSVSPGPGATIWMGTTGCWALIFVVCCEIIYICSLIPPIFDVPNAIVYTKYYYTFLSCSNKIPLTITCQTNTFTYLVFLLRLKLYLDLASFVFCCVIHFHCHMEVRNT